MKNPFDQDKTRQGNACATTADGEDTENIEKKIKKIKNNNNVRTIKNKSLDKIPSLYGKSGTCM